MIESTSAGEHLFTCSVPKCDYQRTSVSPGLVRAAAAWHLYERHPMLWTQRNGAQTTPRMPKPVNM